MASSTRTSACLASCSWAAANCARNSDAVTLSSAAAIRASAFVKAFEASCNLRSASLMTSRRAFSAAWRRLSASCALSDTLLHMDCARASVARTCSSISLKSSAARNTRFRTVLPWSPGKERVKLCRSSSLSKDAFVCTAAFPGTRST